jgi:peptidoglycan hydrolase-like protein with peptidoglycan-binding domain
MQSLKPRQYRTPPIALGARGPHVGKIQRALIELDEATLSQDSIYGPAATAAAVKAYKRARNIVDRRRQTQADDIVGIMTMAALDSEMLAKENVVSLAACSPKAARTGPAASICTASNPAATRSA